MKNRIHRTGRAWIALAAVGTLLASEACGSTGDGSGSPSAEVDQAGVSAAKDAVAAAQAPSTFDFHEPLANVSEANGKKVFFLSNYLSLPFVQTELVGLQDGFDKAGVTLDTASSNGDISAAQRAFASAVSSGYDAIILNSLSTKLMTNSIKQAKAAGIPVLQNFANDPRMPTPEEEEIGVYGQVGFDFSEMGRLIADSAIAESEGRVNAAVIKTSDAEVGNIVLEGIQQEFSDACPTCRLKVYDVLSTDWATRLGPLTDTILQDPSVNYIIPVFDGMATYIVPQIKARNAAGRTSVVSSNADTQQMKELAAGEPWVANVGQPLAWAGWAMADQTLRALVGAEAVADEVIPNRVFNADNIGDIDTSADQGTWFGDADYAGSYLKLWDLS
jgi:ribose transport system substrate-binding protein